MTARSTASSTRRKTRGSKTKKQSKEKSCAVGSRKLEKNASDGYYDLPSSHEVILCVGFHPGNSKPLLDAASEAIPTDRAGLGWLIAAQAVTAGYCNIRDASAVEPWYERLVPYAGTFYLESTSLELARSARLCRALDTCEMHLTASNRSFRRKRLPPFLVTALLEQPQLDLDRGGSGAEERAQRSLEEAREIAESFGLRRHTEVIEAFSAGRGST
jgi:hypothetical protein